MKITSNIQNELDEPSKKNFEDVYICKYQSIH